jgi:hypothetical protein
MISVEERTEDAKVAEVKKNNYTKWREGNTKFHEEYSLPCSPDIQNL